VKDYTYVYLIGIGGIGMSAVARWCHAQQHLQVFGYDRASSALTDQLIQEGIKIHFEDRVDAIPEEIMHHKAQSLIVYTPAISPKNHVLNHLKANNYTLCKRAEILSILTQDHLTLAVAGTHGKTTTSSLAAHILYNAGKNMVAFLGGISKGYASNLLVNGQTNKDTIVVIEADEFDRFFLRLHPHLAIVTTVDPDHLDIYGDAQGFKKAFQSFIALVPTTGKAIVHQKAAQQLRIDKDDANIVCYALTNATVSAENVYIKEGDFYFDYISQEITIRNIRLTVPGYHNVENALAVITACLILGLDAASIREGLATFQGVKRRFDYVIRSEQIIFLDDYAHHPVEITALLQTIRALYPGRSITAVFRPHLYTRTRDLANEFAQSLDLADQVFLLDIYPDREEPIEGVTSACIFDQMTLEEKWMCSTEDNLIDALRKQGKPDIIVMIGAGGSSSFVARIRSFLLENWR
jgi:UDP-N-acetylmuramate--alanine ligase